MIAKELLEQLLAKYTTTPVEIRRTSHVSGGCINTTLKLESNRGNFFVKINSLDQQDLFEKEALGLELLKKHSPISIPEVIGRGVVGTNVYLLMEWIEKGPTSTSFWQSFGEKLAQQHQVSEKQFGLSHDNHIGRLPQSNKQYDNWTDFFVNARLIAQMEIAKKSNLIDAQIINQFETLFKQLDTLVPKEPPTLLHGDLWGGNFLCSANGEAYIFDPAVHYGHRETELAFTTLFGGFDSTFYKSYQKTYPLEPGFEDRIDIHNLYPLLVHVNLFGASYLSGIKSTLKRFA